MKKDSIRLYPYKKTEGEMIGISFPMKEPFKTLIKQLDGRKWCEEHKWVYVKNTPENLKEIFVKFKKLAYIDSGGLYNGAGRVTAKPGMVRMIHSERRKKIYIDLPADAEPGWIKELKDFEGAYYLKETGQWLFTSTDENYRRLTAIIHTF